ncbi:unnamed protein product [Cuscuta epithymum]|uniref:DUF1985 domain-containing protein n=2 Tax=Cuscuta epithymum TaxID=186058 RepID=A0AAV0EJI5_9ASTE|nr:unnamed protein product [Cuscuta epithymum]
MSKRPTISLEKSQASGIVVQASVVTHVSEAEYDIQVPSLSPLVDDSSFPTMKITIRNALKAFQKIMKKWLKEFPEIMYAFRRCVFGAYLDINFIPVPSLLWPMLSKIATIERNLGAWFAVNGVPIRYSITEFALISGLNCSSLDVESYEENCDEDAKSEFIEKHFDGIVSYDAVQERFVQLCKNLKHTDEALKKEAHEEVLRLAKLMFVVMVLLAPSKRKASIPEWIIEKIGAKKEEDFPWGTWAFRESLVSLRKNLDAKLKGIHNNDMSPTLNYTGFLIPISILLMECAPDFAQKFAVRTSQSIPVRPRLCLWTHKTKTKIFNRHVKEAVESTKRVQSILLPDSMEVGSTWMMNLRHIEDTHSSAELDRYVKALEQNLISIPVSCKRKLSEVKDHAKEKRSSKKVKVLRKKIDKVERKKKDEECERNQVSPTQTETTQTSTASPHAAHMPFSPFHHTKEASMSTQFPVNENSVQSYIDKKCEEEKEENVEDEAVNEYQEQEVELGVQQDAAALIKVVLQDVNMEEGEEVAGENNNVSQEKKDEPYSEIEEIEEASDQINELAQEREINIVNVTTLSDEVYVEKSEDDTKQCDEQVKNINALIQSDEALQHAIDSSSAVIDPVESVYSRVQSVLKSLPKSMSSLGSGAIPCEVRLFKDNATSAKEIFDKLKAYPLEDLADPQHEAAMLESLSILANNLSLFSNGQAEEILSLSDSFPQMMREWRELSKIKGVSEHLWTTFEKTKRLLEDLVKTDEGIKSKVEGLVRREKELKAELEKIESDIRQLKVERGEVSKQTKKVCDLVEEQACTIEGREAEVDGANKKMESLKSKWDAMRLHLVA